MSSSSWSSYRNSRSVQLDFTPAPEDDVREEKCRKFWQFVTNTLDVSLLKVYPDGVTTMRPRKDSILAGPGVQREQPPRSGLNLLEQLEDIGVTEDMVLPLPRERCSAPGSARAAPDLRARALSADINAWEHSHKVWKVPSSSRFAHQQSEMTHAKPNICYCNVCPCNSSG